MASRRRARPVATFRQAVDIEVFRPELTLLPSFRFLDIEALSRAASADIPIGEIAGGCCGLAIHAQVRRGKVIGLRAQGCAGEASSIPRDHRKLIAAAIDRVSFGRRRRASLPMPAADFFRNAAVARQTSIDVLVCVRICILGFCTTCCRVVTRPNSDITCGAVTIDTTRPGISAR